ncbi:MAG: DUF1206 domain-containing protein [Actinomycetes bacterium]
MSTTRTPKVPHLPSAHGAARQAADSDPVEKAARLGFVAKGVVYALIGVLAFQVARGSSQRADQKGALQKVAEQPFGTFLLWLMVIGFFAYGLWRFSEAAWGRRNIADEKKRTAKRIGSAVDGAVYVALGVLAMRTATGGSSSSQSSSTARLLDQSGGQTIVVIAGLVIVAVGIGLAVYGLKTDFDKHLEKGRMSESFFRFARRLGQVGYVCRAGVVVLVGVLVVKAAVEHKPGQARGFDAALKSLAGAPFGQVLLIVAAVGLICFGGYCLIESRYRRL